MLSALQMGLVSLWPPKEVSVSEKTLGDVSPCGTLEHSIPVLESLITLASCGDPCEEFTGNSLPADLQPESPATNFLSWPHCPKSRDPHICSFYSVLLKTEENNFALAHFHGWQPLVFSWAWLKVNTAWKLVACSVFSRCCSVLKSTLWAKQWFQKNKERVWLGIIPKIF